MLSQNIKKYKTDGGYVPCDVDYVYVYRKEEEELFNRLKEGESIALYGSRQIGKTTIAMSVSEYLEREGHVIAWLNLQNDLSPYKKKEIWFYEIIRRIAIQLNINEDIVKRWVKNHEDIPLSSILKDFLIEVVWRNKELRNKTISIFFDEIDYTLELAEFTDYLFSGIRAVKTDIRNISDYSPITFTLIGVCPPHELIDEPIRSFGIGKPIELSDFELDEKTIASLAQGLDLLEDTRKDVVSEILKWTGGQPYLTIILCDRFKYEKRQSVDEVANMMKKFISEQKKHSIEHFKAPKDYVLRFRDRAYGTLMVYKEVIEGKGKPNLSWERYYNVLRMTGLIIFRNNKWEVKSPIYKQFYNKIWCNAFASEIGVELPQEGDYFPPVSYGPNKPKLFIFNTGGTIGMEVQADGSVRRYINPKEGFKNNFKEVWDTLEPRCEIIFEELDCLDGANIQPKQWRTIARAIWERRNEPNLRGFVITHGTDTLAFTASAVAFALGRGLKFPVVFTGSQTTYTVSHGDAKSNLLRACLVALEGSIKEVVICFGDKVFRGCRAQKRHDQQFEGFESPSYRPLAHITERIEVQKDLLFKKDKSIPFELKNDFAEGVFQIAQYPALNPKFLEHALEEPELKGIIFQTLGVGNIPTIGDCSLIPFIEKAKKKGIPVLITSGYPINPEVRPRYAPASAPLQAGAIPTGNMTASAAVTKFMWVIAQIDKMIERGDLRKEAKLVEVRRMMDTDYVGEVDPPIVMGDNIREKYRKSDE